MQSNEQTKTYSRKQIINWVQSRSRYKFQELKNGVFFLSILSSLFPQQFQKQKWNPSPVSEYDFTTNINLMKRVLNRHGWQMNLDISNVVKSKNLFQLANWMKNLQEKKDSILEDYYGNGNTEQQKTPGKALKQRGSDPIILQTKKTHSLSKSKRDASHSRSESAFFKSKIPSSSSFKFDPINLQGSKPRSKLLMTSHIWEGEGSTQREEREEDTIEEEMYERALQEAIQGLKKVIERIKGEANEIEQGQSYDAFRKRIQKAIFKKPVQSIQT